MHRIRTVTVVCWLLSAGAVTFASAQTSRPSTQAVSLLIRTDDIGMNWDYPDASYERRREIIKEHENYQKGWLYFIAYDPAHGAELWQTNGATTRIVKEFRAGSDSSIVTSRSASCASSCSTNFSTTIPITSGLRWANETMASSRLRNSGANWRVIAS